jgi:hypothetical protein
MKVFLHIGSHKTGTTAIQDFASENRRWLQKNGLGYHTYELVGGEKARSHLGLVADLSSEKSASSKRALAVDLLQAARSSALQHHGHLLFSAEALFRLQPAARERFCKSFNTVFGNDEVFVVAGLRNQAEFADSFYRNAYRAYVSRPPSFRKWLENGQRLLDYQALISAYLEALGAQPILLPYHKEGRASFLSSFFASIGVSVEGSPSPAKQKNLSLDVTDCLAKKIVMGDGTESTLSKAFNNFAATRTLTTDYGFFDANEERALLAPFRSGNQLLITQFPKLELAIGADIPLIGKKGIDDMCRERAQKRANRFWVERSR